MDDYIFMCLFIQGSNRLDSRQSLITTKTLQASEKIMVGIANSWGDFGLCPMDQSRKDRENGKSWFLEKQRLNSLAFRIN